MARPLKDDSGEPLDETVLLRVTKTQKQTLLPEYASTSGMTEADFMRNRVFGESPRQPIATPERAALIKALGPLGFIRSDMMHVRADMNQILKDRWVYSFIKPERVEAIFAKMEVAIAAIEAIADNVHKNLEDEH